jgi:hypothetical protein
VGVLLIVNDGRTRDKLSDMASGAVSSKVYDIAVVDEMTGFTTVNALVVNTGAVVERTDTEPATVPRSLRDPGAAISFRDAAPSPAVDVAASPTIDDPTRRANKNINGLP